MTNKDWSFDDETQRAQFTEEVTVENCGAKLKLVQRIAGMSRRELAKIMGAPEATLRRIESGETVATQDFLTRLRALCVIGRARFEEMSDSERQKASELIGIGGGAAAGIGASVAAVGAAGVAGFSAAGITSGLAAIGGGAMLAGVGVVAAIPVATGLAGYGLVKAIKHILAANKLETQEVDGKWEIRRMRES